jgi:hypothetical protein
MSKKTQFLKGLEQVVAGHSPVNLRKKCANPEQIATKRFFAFLCTIECGE